jgi:hypothetical protein
MEFIRRDYKCSSNYWKVGFNKRDLLEEKHLQNNDISQSHFKMSFENQ